MQAGEVIRLGGGKPALRPCRFCGFDVGRLTEPNGPHGNGVRCDNCERHLGWLPKEDSADTFDLIED